MNRLDQIDDLLKNSNIEEDQFKMWKENIVTQRFLLEVERDLLKTREDYAIGQTVEEVAFKAIKNGEHCETLEAVLEWKPDELIIE